jgi:hypothetical protein
MSAAEGRFITPDWSSTPQAVPYADFSNPQSLNLYNYMRNNPLVGRDPDGHCCDWDDLSQFASGVADTTYRPIVQAASHPIDTGTGMVKAIAHPVSTAVAIKDAVVTTSHAALSGDPNAIGKVTGTVASALLTAGAAKAASAVLEGAEMGGAAAEVTTALSTSRVTTIGETFYHYGFFEYAESFTGGLRPGGFATSFAELSGADARSGLSLPHSIPPNAVYTVTPKAGTWLAINPIVEPQFGQPGGLVEYQFPHGTGPNTVSLPRLIK